jgi:hypothetical protein
MLCNAHCCVDVVLRYRRRQSRTRISQQVARFQASWKINCRPLRKRWLSLVRNDKLVSWSTCAAVGLYTDMRTHVCVCGVRSGQVQKVRRPGEDDAAVSSTTPISVRARPEAAHCAEGGGLSRRRQDRAAAVAVSLQLRQQPAACCCRFRLSLPGPRCLFSADHVHSLALSCPASSSG